MTLSRPITILPSCFVASTVAAIMAGLQLLPLILANPRGLTLIYQLNDNCFDQLGATLARTTFTSLAFFFLVLKVLPVPTGPVYDQHPYEAPRASAASLAKQSLRYPSTPVFKCSLQN